jgi:glycosyltransferase involved in cell wall biosynthesis
MTPSVTVVVPAFNAEATVAATMRSVLRQSDGDLELVVVDDGSVDGTLRRSRSLEPDPRVRVLPRPHAGLAGALNAGLEEARGDLVAFIGSDDLLLPEYVARVRDTFSRHPKAGLVYTDAWSFDDVTGRFRPTTAGDAIWRVPDPPADPADFLDLLVQRNFIYAAVTVRRSALDAVGGFRESLAAVEDYELWLRLLANGYAAIRVPGPPLALNRERPDSMSADWAQMTASLAEVWGLVVDEHPAPETVKSVAASRRNDALRKLRVYRSPVFRRVLRPAMVAGSSAMRRLRWSSEPPDGVAKTFALARSAG